MGVKDAYTHQLIVLANHREDRTYILDVTQMHGVIDAALNGVKQQFGTLTGGIDQLGLLIADVVGRIDEYTAHQQRDGRNNDAGCQAFEQGGLLADAANRSGCDFRYFFKVFSLAPKKLRMASSRFTASFLAGSAGALAAGTAAAFCAGSAKRRDRSELEDPVWVTAGV